MAAVLSAGFPLVAFLQLVRVYGQALAAIADAEVKLFHLFVHEPLIREGVDGLEIAEEMEGLASELLPLAAPIMEHVHQRWLQHFIEQDVVGHLELEVDSDAELGRLRVAIAFADLAGYTRLTEEAGEEEALDIVERFVESVEETLPDDARVIKTIGDEVMVVGSDPSALVDWAVGFQLLHGERRPLPRIGIHAGGALYRDGDYYGRAVNLASRVGARAAGGEVLVTRPRGGGGGAAPGLPPHRRGADEGLRRGRPSCSSPPRRRSRERRGARAGRAGCWRRARRCSCCSPAGATRSACSTWRCGSAATSPRCTSTTGCAPDSAEDAAFCADLCARSKRRVDGETCRRVRRRATCRRGPANGATARLRELARAARRRDRDRPHRDRPGRDGPLPARGLARAPRAARACAPRARRAAGAAAARGHARGDGGLLRRARPAVARGPEQRLGRLRAQPRARRAAARAARACTRRPRPTSCARSRCCATRPRCSTPPSTPRSTDEQAALAALPPALARLCLQRLADDAAAPAPAPAGGRARRASCSRSAAARGSAALDLGGGLRAVAEYGRLRFERAARRAAGRRRAARGARARQLRRRRALLRGRRGPRDRRRHARPRRARGPARGPPLAAGRPDAPARPRRQPLAAGPLHGPQGPARAARAHARGPLRRRDRLGPRRGHGRALPGRRGHAPARPAGLAAGRAGSGPPT